MSEKELQNEIFLFLGSHPRVRIFRNNTGVSRFIDEYGKKRYVKFGLCVGSSDLIGIIKPEGKFLAIEVKTSKGKLTEYQKNFGTMIRSFGGIFIVARELKDVKTALFNYLGEYT